MRNLATGAGRHRSAIRPASNLRTPNASNRLGFVTRTNRSAPVLVGFAATATLVSTAHSSPASLGPLRWRSRRCAPKIRRPRQSSSVNRSGIWSALEFTASLMTVGALHSKMPPAAKECSFDDTLRAGCRRPAPRENLSTRFAYDRQFR